MEQTEFYSTPQGVVMYHQIGQPVKELHQNDRRIVTEMLDVIRERYPAAFAKLCQLYTVNQMNRCLYEFNIVSRFVRCNFGEYDALSPDIDSIGRFHFEEVKCPLRGECIYEGVICRPVLNTTLSEREIEVMRCIVDGMDSNAISDELNIAPTTVSRHRENIKAKLHLRTSAQVAAYYIENIKNTHK